MTESEKESQVNERSAEVRVALIGAVAIIAAAVIAGIFGIIQSNASRQQPPAVAPITAPVQVATATISAFQPTVEIEGPLTAPLGQRTYYTLVSRDAVRAVWSVGGFEDNQQFEVDPLAPSHQIFVKPSDASRVGDSFTIVVTVYGADGQSATATKSFQVIAE